MAAIENEGLWDEMVSMMEHGRQEFGVLRDLPLYGRKQWERYFQKAFQIYARLWSFIQDNRSELQEEGLKRWEIGEVASRIGQLYYNYYMRTSGLNFLQESHVFYDAIHERGYFTSDEEEELLVKQLRFYTRFITVCLLLGKREEVWEHLEVLTKLIDEFAEEAQPTDILEWRAVTEEMQHFLKADSPIPSEEGSGNHGYTLSLRCTAESPLAGVPFTAPFLKLHEAVLASYWHRQVKLGDLPLDNFRMLQALEWEDPTASGSVSPDTRHHNGEYWARGGDSSIDQTNPAKYLLYRPTASEILAVLATACESLPPVSAILVYISAAEDHVRGLAASSSRAQIEPSSRDDSPEQSRDDLEELSGVCLSPPSSSGLDESYLYPEDILPHTRRPLFLVIDSDNARAFRTLAGRERSYPPCCLMSPIEQPTEISTHSQSGRFFTLFLTSPVLAMCMLVGLKTTDGLLLATCQKRVEAALFELGEELALLAGNEWNDAWVGMFGDVLLRRIVLHFLLCRAAFALHKTYGQVEAYQPTCFPPFPKAASTSADVVVLALKSIAESLGCQDQFDCSIPQRQKSFSESDAWEFGLRPSSTNVLSASTLSKHS